MFAVTVASTSAPTSAGVEGNLNARNHVMLKYTISLNNFSDSPRPAPAPAQAKIPSQQASLCCLHHMYHSQVFNTSVQGHHECVLVQVFGVDPPGPDITNGLLNLLKVRFPPLS